jgi:small basic protein (TIGR04137 family)
MSTDKTLKSKDMLQRHRNVLRRAERIDSLKDAAKWEDGTSAYGLPKVGHRKVTVGKKSKTKKDEAETATSDKAASGKKS